MYRQGGSAMSRKTHGGKGDRRRIWSLEDDDWDRVFKRDKKNTEKNRYKRSEKHEK